MLLFEFASLMIAESGLWAVTGGDGRFVINGVPQTRIAWTTAFCFVVCLAVTWLLGSSEPLTINGTLFTSKFWLKAVDMFIYTSIILIIGCLAGVIVSRFRN